LPPRSPNTAAKALVIDCEPRSDRPAEAVSGGVDAETDRRRHGVVKRSKRMCRDPTEQCPRRLCSEHPGECRGGQDRGQPEPGQRQRMPGYADQGPHDVLGKPVKSRRGCAERRPPPGTVHAEQWSCSTPGRMASLERAPPPISSAAYRTVTCTPSFARATAAASPFGPLPTTSAVVTPAPRTDHQLPGGST
jgi:hypothetical protein